VQRERRWDTNQRFSGDGGSHEIKEIEAVSSCQKESEKKEI
jgi:hypothetical protein